MNLTIINFIKHNHIIANIIWFLASYFLKLLSFFTKINKKNMLFVSLSGRKFDDSPKAIYDEVCSRREFDDWNLIWAFVEPVKIKIPRGKTIKIYTLEFLKALLTSHVWICNSNMTKGVNFRDERIISVETWHGSTLKKAGADKKTDSIIGGNSLKHNKIIDDKTIRCSQSPLDTKVLSHLFNSSPSSFLPVGLPRNDILTKAKEIDFIQTKNKLGLPLNKKIILYAPTWREYSFDESLNVSCKPPIDMRFWKEKLGKNYILLFRVHYSVTSALDIIEDDFIKNVSDYPYINDLYLASDILISDYSSAIIDFSILEKPILCFAYDLEEYEARRGLYWNLEDGMPFGVQKNEKDLLEVLVSLNKEESKIKMKKFRAEHAPFATGFASKAVVDEIIQRLKS